MFEDFKAFIMRGSVVDLAVGIVIGASFTAVVSSLVADILTPLVGVFGEVDFSTWTIQIGQATLSPGLFLNAVISFLILAALMFFFVVRPIARLHKAEDEEETKDPTPSEVEQLIEIRDELRRASVSASSEARPGS